MICPKCKKEMIESITFKKRLLILPYKVYTLFCGGCDYEKIKEIRISKDDYTNALNNRTIKAQNTEILTTDKTYNQKYLNGVVKS